MPFISCVCTHKPIHLDLIIGSIGGISPWTDLPY